MDRHYLLLFITAIIIMLGGMPQSTGAEGTGLPLEPLITEALSKNPVLLTKENQVNAMGERISPAGTLPDPMLRLGLLNMPEKVDFNEDPMSQKQILLTQKMPFPGKLGLKKAIAEDEYLQQKAEFSYQQLEVINKVKVAYFSLFLINKSIEITEKIKTLLEGFLEVARTRYSVGKGIQQDVMKAEVELSRLIEKLITLDQQKATVEAQLNTVLDRPPVKPLEGKPEVKQTSLEIDVKDFSHQKLDDHPLLKSIYFIEEKQTMLFSLPDDNTILTLKWASHTVSGNQALAEITRIFIPALLE
jgi:outer membrane protein TolC